MLVTGKFKKGFSFNCFPLFTNKKKIKR